jgi:hypothetical protein
MHDYNNRNNSHKKCIKYELLIMIKFICKIMKHIETYDKIKDIFIKFDNNIIECGCYKSTIDYDNLCFTLEYNCDLCDCGDIKCISKCVLKNNNFTIIIKANKPANFCICDWEISSMKNHRCYWTIEKFLGWIKDYKKYEYFGDKIKFEGCCYCPDCCNKCLNCCYICSNCDKCKCYCCCKKCDICYICDKKCRWMCYKCKKCRCNCCCMYFPKEPLKYCESWCPKEIVPNNQQ